METVDDFARQLGDAVAVGAVDARSVRLWVRAENAPSLELELLAADGAGWNAVARAQLDCSGAALDRADHTRTIVVPDDVPALGKLNPDRTYLVRVWRPYGPLVGEGRFRTAWHGAGPTEGRLVFGLASCHQPFTGRGAIRAESARMLAASEKILREVDARFLLLVGDQIYADYPPTRSLFRPRFFRQVAPPGRRAPTDCTREELRRLYHERHRIFFGVDGFARLQAALPCYPMLDDHEIRDNFGTRVGDGDASHQALRDGALDAFYDYQASRVIGSNGERPTSFHYSLDYGPAAIFVTDVRSRRMPSEDVVRVYDDEQLADLEAFLAKNAEKPVLGIVVSVPIVHIESWMAGLVSTCTGHGSDAADRWSHPRMIGDRDRFLRLLRKHQCAHPKQRVILLGGDIHVGSAFCLEWSDGGPPTYQFTASALSHLQSRPSRWVAEKLPKTTHRVDLHDGLTADVHLVEGIEGAQQNPYGGLNLGLVEVEWSTECTLRFKLVSAQARSEEPRVVFESVCR